MRWTTCRSSRGAYAQAARVVGRLERPLSEVYERRGSGAIEGLPGIGKSIARRIVGMLETGVMEDLEARRREMPVDVLALTALGGLGPKKVKALWQALGVRSEAELRQAAEAGKIRVLPQFGAVSERRILAALAFAAEHAGRWPLGRVLDACGRLEQALADLPGVSLVAVGGAVRRRCEMVERVEVVVGAEDPQAVGRAFATMPERRLDHGLEAELRVVPPERFGVALLLSTGSAGHVAALRQIGIELAGETEAEVYAALGMQFVPPELREDAGEVALALRGELPELIGPEHIRGDMQMHTTWTDGSESIEGMARAAMAAGREYIVITDHSHGLPMSRGLDEAGLREQIAAIRAVDRSLAGIRVFAGVEVNIRGDGSLDVDDDVLSELDLVGASIHSHFELPRPEMTRRIVRAIENPHVDVLFHPTARQLGRRRAVDFDLDAVIEACLRTGTILEIDAQPQRLDLPDAMVRRAIEAGVKIAINSDAHRPEELRYVDTFGVWVARRGWAEPHHVVNTLPASELLSS